MMAKWGKLNVHGLHATPNWNFYNFADLLGKINSCSIRHSLRNLCILGYFNANATLCVSSCTGARGEVMEVWTAGLDLGLINRES